MKPNIPTIKRDTARLAMVLLASIMIALNIKIFVRAGGLFPGGVTGVSVLIQRAAEMFFHIQLPYTAINVLINLVPIYIGFRFIGKKFTIYSCIMIVLTSVLTDLLPARQGFSSSRLACLFPHCMIQ